MDTESSNELDRERESAADLGSVSRLNIVKIVFPPIFATNRKNDYDRSDIHEELHEYVILSGSCLRRIRIYRNLRRVCSSTLYMQFI